MAKIKKFTKKAERSRNRVRRFRKRRKLLKEYENEVRTRLFLMREDHKLTFDIDEDNETKVSEESDKFKEDLKYWAVTNRISQTAINDLLKILISAGFSALPKDSRTFMHTPKAVDISTLSHGKLWYNGISNCLLKLLSNCDHDLSIHLDFNFDGLPIFNSSKLQFWPILGSIQGKPFKYALIS